MGIWTIEIDDQYYSTDTWTIYHKYDNLKGPAQITSDCIRLLVWFTVERRIGDGMVEAGKSIAQGVPWHAIWAEKMG